MILYGSTEEEEPEEEMEISDFDDRWYTLAKGGLTGMLKRCFKFTTSESIRSWAEDYMDKVPCEECGGTRLRKESLWFKIDDKNIGELAGWDMDVLADWFKDLDSRLNEKQRTIAKDLLKEISAI